MGQKMVPCKFRDDSGDLDKIKRWGICNNFNQFIHLSSASSKLRPSLNYDAYVFKKKSKYVGKRNVFVNRFNASTAPDFKQKQYLHRILF